MQEERKKRRKKGRTVENGQIDSLGLRFSSFWDSFLICNLMGHPVDIQQIQIEVLWFKEGGTKLLLLVPFSLPGIQEVGRISM